MRYLAEYPNYGITRSGKIFSIHRNKYLRTTGKDYRSVTLRHNGKKKYFFVHVLVARAYLKNPEKLPVVNHKDGNKLNNRVENLEWTTYSGNTFHSKKSDPQKIFKRPILQYDLDGEFVEEFRSISEASNVLGISGSCIGRVCRGERKTTGGFYFKFKETYKYLSDVNENLEWRTKENFNYFVSNEGHVRKHGKNCLMSPHFERGYPRVTLRVNNKNVNLYVHRLVAELFLPNPNNFPVVNHIDGNPKNNNVNNLEWCTYQHNSQHAHDTGLNNSKKKVVQYDLKGNYIKTHNSLKDAAKSIGTVTYHSISRVCRKAGTTKTSAGFIWRFENDPLKKNEIQVLEKGFHKRKKCQKVDAETGTVIKEYESVRKAALDNEISSSAIAAASRGKVKTAGGYKWRYV